MTDRNKPPGLDEAWATIERQLAALGTGESLMPSLKTMFYTGGAVCNAALDHAADYGDLAAAVAVDESLGRFGAAVPAMAAAAALWASDRRGVAAGGAG